MRRDDYKDALNELQLSSKFCEEIEKKLAESKQINEDEYEDVVTHVDVVKPKRHRGLAAAAAFVICAGAVGGGAYYRYNSTSNTLPKGEQMVYNDYYCHFPFATLPIHDAVFYVKDREIAATVIAYESIAKKLHNFFENTEWTEIPSEQNGLSIYNTVGISFSVEKYSITIMSNDTVKVCKVRYFDSDGNDMGTDCEYTPLNGSVKYENYEYALPEGSYTRLIALLLENRMDQYTECGIINASFKDAAYHTPKSDGNVSELQAYSVSELFGTTPWKEATDEIEEAPDEDPITLDVQNDKARYKLRLYKDSVLYISKISLDSGEEIKKTYTCDDLTVYNRLKSVLSDLGNGRWIDVCPIDFKYEDAVVFRKENGIEKAYLVNFGMYNELADMLETFEWCFWGDIYILEMGDDGYYTYGLDGEKLAESDDYFKIVIGDQLILVNDNNNVNIKSSYRYSISVNDYSTLRSFVNNITGRSMEGDELVDWFINNTVNNENGIYYKKNNAEYIENYKQRKVNDISEIRNNLMSFEWTKTMRSEFDDNENITYGPYYGSDINICIDANGNMMLSVGNLMYCYHTDDERFTELYEGIKAD